MDQASNLITVVGYPHWLLLHLYVLASLVIALHMGFKAVQDKLECCQKCLPVTARDNLTSLLSSPS